MKSYLFLFALIGSLSAAFGKTIYVSPDGTGDGTEGNPFGTVWDAVKSASANDTIKLADGTYKNETGKGSGGNACYYEIGSGKGGVTVEGNIADPSKVVIDVAGNNPGLRLFLIQGAGVTIKGITIRNFNSNTGTSPLIRAAGGAKNFTLSDCVFSNVVKSADNGSVLTASDAGIVVDSCNFIACTNTAGTGGAIFMEQDNKVTRCFFENCCASASGDNRGIGGAIYVNGSAAIVSDCVFTNCLACGQQGGAIFVKSSGNTVSGCRFYDCFCTPNNAPKGGAFYADATCTLVDSEFVHCGFTKNAGTPFGSAVYFNAAGSLTNVTIRDCEVIQYALCFNANANCVGCTFKNNKPYTGTTYSGCAIGLRNHYDATLDRCAFINNVGQRGSCIHTKDTVESVTVRNSLFVGNVTTTGNGGMATEVSVSGNFVVDNCTFANNRCTGTSNDYGCPLEIYGGTLTANNCIFWDNWKTVGATQLRSVYVRAGSGTLSHSVYDGMRSSNRPTISECQVITACPFTQDGSWEGDVFTPGDYTLAKKVDDGQGGRKPNTCLGAGVKLDWMTKDSKDLAGRPRLRDDNLVDLGCYEFFQKLGLMLLLR